jgi:chorismate mutase
MNSPKSQTPVALPHDISDVRTQIDAIDAQIGEFIARRCGLSAAVANAKRALGDHAFGWRPAREVEILRTVMRQQASLNPELAFCIWRALISANLAAQGDLSIVSVSDTQSQAKAAFSVGVTIEVLDDSKAVLSALVHNDHAIGVLPWPTSQNWWVTMMEPQFGSLHVCAASPLTGGNPDVMLIAARKPEAAGEDIALIAGPIGAVEGGAIAQYEGLELVACGEFVSPEMPLPHGCRLIGSFALA